MFRMMNHDGERRRRKKLPPKRPVGPKGNDETLRHKDTSVGQASTAQKLATRHGMYTLATVAKMLDRKPVTIRRWLRFEECPKPTHFVTYNGHYEMMLFTDDDVALLTEWRDAMRPGRPRKVTSARTQRRRPNEPFYRETEQRNRFDGTTKTLMARKETPVEYWARVRGNEVEEFQHSPMGRNVVTSQRIVRRSASDDPTARRLVRPNVTQRPKSGEKRRKKPGK